MEEIFFKQSYIERFHENIGLVLYNCGFEKCKSSHLWGPALRDHFLIHYIVEGKGTFQSGNKTYKLSKGDGFYIEANTIVSYQADKDDPWQYHWVGFNGSDAKRMMEFTSFSLDNPIFHYEKDDLLKNLLSNIYNSAGSQPCDEMATLGNLLLFISNLVKIFGINERSFKNGFEYVEKALRFIEHNFSSFINVDDIAASAGISRSHLYRLFMQSIQMSPNEYLITYRINVACTLMRTNGLTVCEAANSCGFSDQLYFSRVFKRLKGVPPSKYAKANR